MKLCQKCADGCDSAFDWDIVDGSATPKFTKVSELDCEFWAHKALLNVVDKFGMEVGAFWMAWLYPSIPTDEQREQMALRSKWAEKIISEAST